MKTPKEWMEEVVTDYHLVENARAALEYDPSVGHAGSVEVNAHDGVVTITGTVYSRAQRSAVERAVRRAASVTRVINDLRVDPPKSVLRPDEEVVSAIVGVNAVENRIVVEGR